VLSMAAHAIMHRYVGGESSRQAPGWKARACGRASSGTWHLAGRRTGAAGAWESRIRRQWIPASSPRDGPSVGGKDQEMALWAGIMSLAQGRLARSFTRAGAGCGRASSRQVTTLEVPL
jgi:hypothetical protein